MASEQSARSIEGWTGFQAPSESREERKIASVANAMRLIEKLDTLGEAGVSELSRELGVSKPAVDRLLVTLLDSGFVEQNAESRRYRLSIRFIAIANGIRPRTKLPEIARPYLLDLNDRFHETVHLGVVSNGNVVYAETVPSRQMFRIEAKPGTTLPAYCTALGKAVLAHRDADEVEQYLRTVVPVAYTRYTTTDFGALRQQIASVRRDGFALDLGEILEEVCCLAAPVLDSKGRALAALSVTAPRSLFLRKREELEQAVPAAARQLTADAIASDATVDGIEPR
ncbi:IclR family transcriptional regulator [Streptomyces sp. NPDC088350]|uniref:IclR family transcriptional regulator n=1 Tax=Streptomyces sp. NPDC088350 TaxID=3365854 RepID=UPI00382428E1